MNIPEFRAQRTYNRKLITGCYAYIENRHLILRNMIDGKTGRASFFKYGIVPETLEMKVGNSWVSLDEINKKLAELL